MILVDIAPLPTPETKPFWDGITAAELRLPRCRACRSWFFPPSPVCPSCTARGIEWHVASGRASLYSYVITHKPLPGWSSDGPMSVALVSLEEGPRIVSTVIDCDQTPSALLLDMPLMASFRCYRTQMMLCFAPLGHRALL